MSENLSYDEDKAICFIRNYLPEETKNNYSDDEILFVIDCIWDYYEDNGLLDLSDDSDDAIDFDNLYIYIEKSIKKDGEISINKNDLKCIIKGELEYEESLDIFND